MENKRVHWAERWAERALERTSDMLRITNSVGYTDADGFCWDIDSKTYIQKTRMLLGDLVELDPESRMFEELYLVCKVRMDWSCRMLYG